MKILIALLIILQNFYFPSNLPPVPPQDSLFEIREIKNSPEEMLYIDKSLHFTVQYPKNLSPYVGLRPEDGKYYASGTSFMDADGVGDFAISRQVAEYSSPAEAFKATVAAHDNLVKSGSTTFTKERRPEIVKQEVQDGRDFLTSSTYHDGIDEKGNPLYYKGLSTTFIKDGYIYYLDSGLKYDNNRDYEKLLADHLKFVHSFHFHDS